MALNDSEDVWVWSSGNSAFTVKDARGKIDDSFLPDDGFKTRWNSRRGIEVDSITCSTCDNGIDTSYHTMWVCLLATTVWNRVFKWLDLSPPDFLSLRGLFSWLDDLHISSSKKDIIEVVYGVVLWSLWNIRNDMIFDNTHPSRSTLFDKIVDFFRLASSCFVTFALEPLSLSFDFVFYDEIFKSFLVVDELDSSSWCKAT
nr:RNA-directed DNA polymerase, eukaryota [Tanacetum cinerariifolium]